MARNIALMLVGVSNTNCGGAERFFSDFYSRYADDEFAAHNLYFFCDRATFRNMQLLGKLRTDKNVVLLSNFSNRFKNWLERLQFLFKILQYRINVLHVTSYTSAFHARIAGLHLLPKALRPKLVLSIVDCEMPYVLSERENPRYTEYADKYLHLFRTARIDGVLTWYANVVEFLKEKRYVPGLKVCEAFVTRYSDLQTGAFDWNKKEKVIVWAARLTRQKHPLMFLKAVSVLSDMAFDFRGWTFEVYGEGPLEAEVVNFIGSNDLGDIVKYMGNKPLEEVFRKSTCFVSTQEHENFPSMSMMEAMYYGNVIIARNVGQTNLMVRNRINGYLLDEDSAEGLAMKIREFLKSDILHKPMGMESTMLTKRVHTYRNFASSIDAFWNKTLTTTKALY